MDPGYKGYISAIVKETNAQLTLISLGQHILPGENALLDPRHD